MIGIGVNIRPFLNKVARAAADYYNRVTADGGVSESPDCVNSGMSDLDRQNLLNNASLLLIPSGYKGGKLYAEIPTNGNGDLTWTRGSDAFRTNASGLIQRVPWNLLSYSNTPTDSSWSKLGLGAGTAPVVTANAGTSPDGTTNASRVQFNCVGTTSSDRSILQKPSIALINGANYAGSIYVKAYSSGEIGKQLRFIVEGVTSQSIITLTDSWQRVAITGTSSTTSSNYIIETRGGTTTNTTADVLIYGAQLVEGTTAQTYLPTTDRLNFPRLSYMYGSCPAVLLEPQRTNLILQSQDFDSATWVKDNSSVTANTTTSPDGTNNADTYTGNGTSSVKFTYQTNTITSGTTYSISIYAKKNTNNFLQVSTATASFGVNAWANFDLNNGVVGSVGSSATASIVNVGNGWYRCVITAPAVATGTFASALFTLITSATSVRGESNTLSTSVYLWGAQLEQGAYPTTYIPTTSATATRVADECSKSGISSLIGQSEGSIFFEVYFTEITNAQFRAFFCLEGSVSSQFSGFVVSTTNNGNDVSYAGTNYSLTTGRHKVICTYSQANNQRKLFVDGVLRGTSTHTNFLSTIDRLSIGCRINPFSAFQSDRQLSSNSEISKFAVFNSLLTDTQCQTLTT